MNRPLRVLMVGPLPPPSGGMANQTAQLARLLSNEGVQVTIARTNAPYAPAWVGSVRGVRAVLRLVPYVWRLWRETGRADVVHVMANSGWAWFLFAAPALRIAGARKVPAVVNYRGGLAREFLERSAKRVVPRLRAAAALVVPSGFLKDCFAAYDIPADVIPNVVDVEVFRPLQARAARIAGPHIVIARNLELIYGIDTALHALAMLSKTHPGLRVSVAGSGPERKSLEGLVEQLALTERVRFTGRLDVPAMAALYRDADLVLNPSRADNTPNSILEALACGVPVVSTNVGGVPYLVRHGETAWLVPPDAPEPMAAGVATVLADAQLRDRLRENGLRLAHGCSWPVVKDHWLGTYRRLAAVVA